MECPDCQSIHLRKNGQRRGQQNHLCLECGRQCVEHPSVERGYSDDIRQ